MDSIVMYYQEKCMRNYSSLDFCLVNIGYKAKPLKHVFFLLLPFFFSITNFCTFSFNHSLLNKWSYSFV